MRVPGVFVSVIMPAMEVVPKPGRGRPLWASQMVDALNQIVIGRLVAIPDRSFLSEMQNELRDILGFQAYVRGCSPPRPETVSSLEVEFGPGVPRLSLPERWVEEVDRHFGNSACPRCTLLVTPGVVHTDDQCDLDLAAFVLSA